MIKAEDVVEAMGCLEAGGIRAWLDGGWGVDALLEEQTREHEDLDLVIELGLADRALEVLGRLGYAVALDERPTRVVLRDENRRQIDLHTVVFDKGGGGIQRLERGGAYRYPPEGFKGWGKIGVHLLPCLTPEVQLECHAGYEPTDTDRQDVKLLVDRFRLAPPQGY